jgi:hypothetical protein
MKTTALLFAAALMLTTARAQEAPYFAAAESHRNSDPDRAIRSYCEGLDSRNEGVAVSALAHIGRLQLYFPDRRFPEMAGLVSHLSATGSTPELRYRAYLICTLMASPALFAEEGRKDFRTPDELFTALAQRMQRSMLGYDSVEEGN